MPTNVTITLPKQEKERLSRLALNYGLSLKEFSRRILEEVASEIPEESIEEYEKPGELKASFGRALRDWRMGRASRKL